MNVKEYLNQYYNLQREVLPAQFRLGSEKREINGECNCVQNKVLSIKQGYLDPNVSDAQRISQIIRTSVGGRTTFGNVNGPLQVNELGGYAGQSGGMPRPPRNKF